MTDLHTAAKQDIPDLIAGALGVSRGTAYDMMREALAEQPAQRKPLTLGQKQKLWSSVGHKPTLKDRVNAYGFAIEAAHGITGATK